MILSVHAIFGATIASQIPENPVLGFTLALASHLVLDAIPHKDYKLTSVKFNEEKKPQLIDLNKQKKFFLFDIFFVSFDALCGLFLAYYFFFNPVYPWIFLIGAVASLIPDFLSFLYIIFKQRVFPRFFKFHVLFCHSKITFKFNHIIGVCLQYLTVIILIGFVLNFKYLF